MCIRDSDLLGWLKHPDRAQEPGGRIGFAVSARLSADLTKALATLAESAWQTFATEADGTLRQWAEVAFVPNEEGEKKDRQPLRYVGLRRQMCIRDRSGGYIAAGWRRVP